MRPIRIETVLENKGHYVPGMISNGMLYISGQLAVHHDSGAPMAEDIATQTEDALCNVERVLHAAGLKREDVVQCRLYIPDVQHWDIVNTVYARFFGEHRPARAIIPCRELHFGAMIEIEALAEMK